MTRNIFWGSIIILLGLSMLFRFPFFSLFFALFLIWIGVRIMTGKRGRFGDFWHETNGVINEDYLKRVLIFSGLRAKLNTTDFQGMELVAIFGGGELDASDIKTKEKEIEISLVTVFGGLKLKLPHNWQVKSEGVGIIGGFDNATQTSSKPDVIVHLKGVAIFGGVEILN